MKIFEYQNMEAAKAKQLEMKKAYGYTPEVMRVKKITEHNATKFIVIKPTSLLKISGKSFKKYLPKGVKGSKVVKGGKK